MAYFDTRITDILSYLNHAHKKYFKTVPKSYSLLRPGSVILFRYNFPEDNESEYRLALVVRNQLGKVGYTSLRGNPLLSCYRLNDAPEVLVKLIMLNLYKNETLCSYDTIQKGLSSLIGDINYRTYMFSRMQDLRYFMFDKTLLPPDEENGDLEII